MEYQCEISTSIHETSRLPSFPPLDHDDMVTKAGLCLSILGVPGSTGLQLESHVLERGIETSPSLPAKGASYKESVFNPSSLYMISECSLPCLALSSENSRATSSNLVPLRSFSSASSFFACFSH